MSLTEICRQVGIHKSRAFSILETLQRFGLVQRRNPIDFGIVSVASIIAVDKGVCTDARIVLGAVAPEPVRATKAEEVLKGQSIDEDRAAEAAKEALAGAKPLDGNAYKVEITRALVKRAILG